LTIFQAKILKSPTGLTVYCLVSNYAKGALIDKLGSGVKTVFIASTDKSYNYNPFLENLV